MPSIKSANYIQGNQNLPGPDGWAAAEAWTYASATTFTIVGDYSAKYAVGDKIKLTQTTVKYFYIIGISFATNTTTLTIIGGSDYTLANAAITVNFYSKAASPASFPKAFNYSPSIVGFSANPINSIYRFWIIGGICYVWWSQLAATGTSNSTSFSITLPIVPANIANAFWEFSVGNINNGANGTTPGTVTIAGNTIIATIYRLPDGTLWTATGAKGIKAVVLAYEI